MSRLIGSVVAFLLTSSCLVAQTLIDAFEVINRVPRNVPVLIDSFAIINRNPNVAFDPRKLRLTRCDTKADVPFFLEPWKTGTDSVMCWVRIDNAPASRGTNIFVYLEPSQSISRSNGNAVFLTFQDSIRPTSSIGPGGPWAPWQGVVPTFGRGLIVESRITALTPAAGYLCYFGADASGSNGYVIKHEARPGEQSPDHLRVNAGSASPILNGPGPHYREWAVNEPVRYVARLTTDSNIIERRSEVDPLVWQRFAIKRDSGLSWTMHGVAALPGFSQRVRVDYVHTRPIYEYRPRTTRRGALITASPLEAVICNGSPVTLTAPSIGWRTFRWSNGATTPSIVVSQPGSYTVELSDGSCTVTTLPIVVKSDRIPTAGNDTTITLCLGRKDTLRVAPGFSEYEWYMSSGLRLSKLNFTGPFAVIDSADVYRCFVRSAGGCVDTVRFIVNRVYDTTAKIVFPFTNPTLCAGDSIVLRADPPQSAQYQWYRNGVLLTERTDRLIVKDSGTYTVNVRIGNANDGCISISSIKVAGATKDTFRFPSRSVFCEGDSVTLDAGTFPQVEWWRLSGPNRTLITAYSRTITLKTSDTIQCIGSNSGVCRDTAYAIVEMLPAPRFTMDTDVGKKSMCIGETFVLRSNAKGASYDWKVWNTPLPQKKDSAQIQIVLPGQYFVTVTYANGCKRVDSIMIDDGLAPPDLIALDGQSLCPGDSTRLTTKGRFTTYAWNTGETNDTIWVKSPGVYNVTVTLFGCTSDQSILIEWSDPKGPTITYEDSVTICPASPSFRLRLRNNQSVPRQYLVDVKSDVIFTVKTPRVAVRPQDTAYLDFEVKPGVSTDRFITFDLDLSDDCQWSTRLRITVENREKVVPLELAVVRSQPSIRAGDEIRLQLRGPGTSSLQEFRQRDTIWVETSVPPDLFEIISASARCDRPTVALDEARGTVRYQFTSCQNGSSEPLAEQVLSVLVGETLTGFLTIDTTYSSGPCVSAPIMKDTLEIPLTPFGCEVTTISRTSTLIVGIGPVVDASVTTIITAADGPVHVRVVDVLGRIVDQTTVTSVNGRTECRVATGSDRLFYVQVQDSHSMVTFPVFGMQP